MRRNPHLLPVFEHSMVGATCFVDCLPLTERRKIQLRLLPMLRRG